MAADAARAADTRGWLRRAAADLRGADVDLVAAPPLLVPAEAERPDGPYQAGVNASLKGALSGSAATGFMVQ
jgi:hypothetical protein